MQEMRETIYVHWRVARARVLPYDTQMGLVGRGGRRLNWRETRQSSLLVRRKSLDAERRAFAEAPASAYERVGLNKTALLSMIDDAECLLDAVSQAISEVPENFPDPDMPPRKRYSSSKRKLVDGDEVCIIPSALQRYPLLANQTLLVSDRRVAGLLTVLDHDDCPHLVHRRDLTPRK